MKKKILLVLMASLAPSLHPMQMEIAKLTVRLNQLADLLGLAATRVPAPQPPIPPASPSSQPGEIPVPPPFPPAPQPKPQPAPKPQPTPVPQPKPQPKPQPTPAPTPTGKPGFVIPLPTPTEPVKPLKITKVEKPAIEVAVPTIRIANLMALDTGYIKPLQQMKELTDKEKALKKAQARGILNGILEFLGTGKYKAAQNQPTVKSAVEAILTVDPLLISTAAIVLRIAEFPANEIYTIMTNYYKERIQFIANELDSIIKRKGKPHKGLRDDIDEALTYPIELEGEIQTAETTIQFNIGKERDEAQAFINRINELRKWLLELLKKEENKRILEEVGLPVEFYIDIFEPKKHRVYCVTEKGDQKEWVHFIDDLKEITIEIEAYQKESANYSRSLRTYKIQNIVNKLKGFLAHATEQSYCQICLEDDIIDIRRQQLIGEFDINKTFNIIESFLKNIYNTQKNEAVKYVLDNTLPDLIKAIENKGCPIKRN